MCSLLSWKYQRYLKRKVKLKPTGFLPLDLLMEMSLFLTEFRQLVRLGFALGSQEFDSRLKLRLISGQLIDLSKRKYLTFKTFQNEEP